jgi:hypothetical protein
MHLQLMALFVISTIAAAAQPQVFDHAIITTRATMSGTDSNQVVKPAPTDDKKAVAQGNQIMIGKRADEPGETISNTWYKGDMVKIEIKTGAWRCVTIKDNAAQKTSSFAEILEEAAAPQAALNMPGSSQLTVNEGIGFYATEAELWANYQKQLAPGSKMPDTTQSKVDIVYEDETKEIAGYPCKKATIIITPRQGAIKKIVAWYNTQVKLPGLGATGDPAFAGLQIMPNKRFDALAQLAGFPMEYSVQFKSGQTMTVEVTKLKTDKKVPDWTFKIPGSVNMKPLKDYNSSIAIFAQTVRLRIVENNENSRPVKQNSGNIFDY